MKAFLGTTILFLVYGMVAGLFGLAWWQAVVLALPLAVMATCYSVERDQRRFVQKVLKRTIQERDNISVFYRKQNETSEGSPEFFMDRSRD